MFAVRFRCSHLSLHVISSDDVTHRAQSGRLDIRRLVHEQLHESASDSGLNDGLDLLVLRASVVAHVRESPARVREHLVVQHV